MSVVYGTCAAVFGLIFVVQLVLSLLGGDHHDGGIVDDAGLDHDSSGIFGILSFRTVTAALAFFGVAGLAGQQNGWSANLTLLVASAAGALALYGVYWMGTVLRRLNSDATVDPRRAVGSRGTVYLRVPGQQEGQGKVHVSQQGRTLEYQAVTKGEPLPSGAAVVVVDYVGSDTVEVEAAP